MKYVLNYLTNEFNIYVGKYISKIPLFLEYNPRNKKIYLVSEILAIDM